VYYLHPTLTPAEKSDRLRQGKVGFHADKRAINAHTNKLSAVASHISLDNSLSLPCSGAKASLPKLAFLHLFQRGKASLFSSRNWLRISRHYFCWSLTSEVYIFSNKTPLI